MRPLRLLALMLVAMMVVGGGIAQASPGHDHGDEHEHPEEHGVFPGENFSQPPGPDPEPAPQARAKNIQVLGHANPGGFNADVVAHRGYAYLGSWGNISDPDRFCPSQGVRVYDLKNPANPTLVSTFADGVSEPDVAGTWTEKVIVRRVNTASFTGDLAAVSFQNCRPEAETFRGFGLYDVTDPANPKRLGLYRAESETRGSHELWLQVRGDRAYVYTAIIFSELTTAPDAGTPGRADFRIVDVSDPANPTDVGEWGAWAELGVPPIYRDENGVTRSNFVHSVIGDGTRAYLSYWDLGTVILDVSDVADPKYIGRTEFEPHEEGNAHSAWLGKGGNLLIQTDEDFNPGPHPSGALELAWGYPRFFDISDPANPVQLATFKLPTTTQYPPPVGFYTVHDPKVRGNLAYFSWYAEGVVVVDISRPANPRFVAQFRPEPSADPYGFFFPGEEFPNVWGVFVDRNYILASDINNGLWVLKLR